MVKVVLVNPQIPPNTGNIARTCAATQTELHLVGPLGFELSDRYLKRAGLDYWPYVDLHFYPDCEAFVTHWRQVGGNLLGFSVTGTVNFWDYHYQATDWLLMGSETDGLPQSMRDLCAQLLCIPMPQSEVRSLNLASSTAIALFEARRQLRQPD
ncbi:MAG: tRNA (uridine(34)/cytosine(34)/5-carboxymethylaminomethyluridine(34)-2'-O)-methyltransferase TrmL [Synechocystis sp.]